MNVAASGWGRNSLKRSSSPRNSRHDLSTPGSWRSWRSLDIGGPSAAPSPVAESQCVDSAEAYNQEKRVSPIPVANGPACIEPAVTASAGTADIVNQVQLRTAKMFLFPSCLKNPG